MKKITKQYYVIYHESEIHQYGDSAGWSINLPDSVQYAEFDDKAALDEFIAAHTLSPADNVEWVGPISVLGDEEPISEYEDPQ